MNKTTGIGFDPLFDNAAMGIVVADEKGIIVMTNPFLQQQFGYLPDELNGSPVEKLIPTRFENRHKGHVHEYNRTPKSRPMGLGMDLFGLRNDGSEFPVEVSLSSYDTEHGKFTIAFISDISARKKAELALKELNEVLEAKVTSRTATLTSTVKQLAELVTETEHKDIELNRANAFLRSIWGHAEVILFVTDAHGTIKYFNPAAERELGYLAGELIDVCSPEVLHEHNELLKRAIALSKVLNREVQPDFDALKSGTDAAGANEFEIEFLRKDGSRFPASLTITAMRSSTEAPLGGYLGVAMNISKQKNAEAELRAALEKEKEVSEFKSRFVSMASHEFRTPLSTILSSAYLISKYTSLADQPKRERHVGRVVSMVQLLTDILNDFLSLEKIEQNKIEIHYSSFNLQEHIHSIISELDALKKAGQQIHFVHTGPKQVYLDPAMLKHIVINLVSNALKFSPEGSLLEVSSCVEQNRLLLKVRDQGIGISEEDQQHLFERFFRGSNAGHIQGTGLGLHIVSRYVGLMEGKISCKSIPGAGSEFVVEFNKNSFYEKNISN